MADSLKAKSFLLNTLGDEGLEAIQKFEIWKQDTNTVLDHEEIKTALQIVPRTVLSLLRRETEGMRPSEGREFKLPVDQDAHLSITKFSNDVYSGSIRSNGKQIASFRHRSLPGVGLVIMTTFELYDLEDVAKPKVNIDQELEDRIQDIVEDKLRMRDMISKMVDRKIAMREALDQMVRDKLTQVLMAKPSEPEKKVEELPKQEKEPLKLRKFLDKAKSKRYGVRIEKNESVSCPDCGQKIFEQGAFSGCLCYGEDRNKGVHVAKTEDGFSIRFAKGWDVDNIEMLMKTLISKENRG